MASKRSAAHESVRAYRARMKQQGFRQISIWVPGTKSPKFRKECRRQSRLGNTLMIRVGRALSVWLGMS
jgi:hypothetical protein